LNEFHYRKLFVLEKIADDAESVLAWKPFGTR